MANAMHESQDQELAPFANAELSPCPSPNLDVIQDFPAMLDWRLIVAFVVFGGCLLYLG